MSTLLDINQAAERLNTSVRHIRGLVYRREIPYFKIGHFLRFNEEDLTIWLAANHVPAIRGGCDAA